MADISEYLKQHSLRITKPRLAVFTALQQKESYYFIADIIKSCPSIDRTSIYRTLEIFQQIGVVQVLHIGFKKGYELAEPFKEHHHHIHCTHCNEVVSIQSSKLEQVISQIASGHHYQLSSHHIELWGICSDCKKS